MKKVTAVLSVFLVSISVLYSTALAAPGLDYIGHYPMHYKPDAQVWKWSTSVAYSGGGDFRICPSGASSAKEYVLWENDPGEDNDDHVGRVTLEPRECYTFRDIGRFVDGDNRKAEFYVTTRTASARSIAFLD
ncbi:hypothetical protein I6N90_05875 [Paenibacillus sp. GSMTC-2017]|uniref:hypothetical protein n=1 Tax=Paenibacillus sp. GSMTC-2017 TaxID=2794350 RepID=UPI0018D7A0C0|nr:hypothetical protein [Paenibacillus sp. GSMTC-2017]MBH5317340.1 hypothetical protein [Paenibacillus sp. GSMTC-2017]